MGQFCNRTTLTCETDRCPATQTLCGAGMTCVPMTNTCKADPCQTIQCPTDACWTCKVTPDGIGTCIPDAEKCEQITITVGQKGGGNGCSCDAGGSAASGPLALLLGIGLVVVAGRRRQGARVRSGRTSRRPRS